MNNMSTLKITPNKTVSPAFTGYKIVNKSRVPEEILEAIENANFLKKFDKDQDVYVRIMTSKTDPVYRSITGDRNFYNLSFSLLPKDSIMAKIKDFFHISKRHRLVRSYIPKLDLINCLQNPSCVESLKSRLISDLVI